MATVSASIIGTDAWNVKVHGTISFAARLAGAIKERRVTLQLAFCFWRVNRKLDRFLEGVYCNMDKAVKGMLPAQAPPDPQRIGDAIASLRNLHHVLREICDSATDAGLERNSLVERGLSRMRCNDERVEELADWISDMTSPQEMEKLFADAKAEYERGETVTLND